MSSATLLTKGRGRSRFSLGYGSPSSLNSRRDPNQAPRRVCDFSDLSDFSGREAAGFQHHSAAENEKVPNSQVDRICREGPKSGGELQGLSIPVALVVSSARVRLATQRELVRIVCSGSTRRRFNPGSAFNRNEVSGPSAKIRPRKTRRSPGIAA